MAIECKVEIDIEKCKGCGRCISECKKEALSLGSETNNNGYIYVVWDEEKGCVGCGNCFNTCPDYCFTIYRE